MDCFLDSVLEKVGTYEHVTSGGIAFIFELLRCCFYGT